MGSLKLVTAAALLVLAVGCAAPRPPLPVTQRPAAPAAAVPANWPTLTDTAYGFSLRYPAGWSEKFDQPAGFHALASRADLSNLLELGSQDYWFVAQAGARDPASGCGEPAQGPVERSSTTLGGLPATRYVVTGTQGDRVQHIVDVISLRGVNCFTLQLVTGAAIPMDRALSTLQQIQTSYRFSVS
jgi:hypothetical protein